MAGASKIRISTHVEVAWPQARTAAATCPNCGFSGPMAQLLDIDYRPPDARHFFTLHVCPACTVRFADNPETMDYGTETLIEMGWNAYQIQLGAGLWPIVLPLTRIQKQKGARILEIGGAHGFGLDFGIRGQGWEGQGFDPSPLAAFGAEELGLSVRQDYFTEAELGSGPYDVAVATEVVEHLPHPPAFLSLMRKALADDGILVLTTPDAAWITPDLPAARLMPLLSPGAHLVLQTADSLRTALTNAGFAHVVIRRESMSLVAYASAAPITLLDDPAAARALYRTYLVERARITADGTDLLLGFAGRALFEAVNDGDAAGADAAWAMLLPAVQARFGLDLAALQALPPGLATLDLAALAEKIPLGLGTILFARAMYLLGAHTDRAAVKPLFTMSVAAIDALQDALARRSLTDGLSASIRNVAAAELALCAAEAGEAAAVPAIAAIAARDPAQTWLGWRGLIALVNAGAFGPAASLQYELHLREPAPDMPAGLRLDVLKSLANFALRPGGEAQAALRHADALRAAGHDADAIILQAFTRLVGASRYDEALAVEAAYDLKTLSARPGVAAHDAKLARMVLDLAVGDPAMIPERLRGLDIAPARRDAMLLEAFIRLVNASRYQEAEHFIRDHDIAALSARTPGDTGRNAQLARTVLDLAVGDPAEVPRHLAGLDLDPARRGALLLEAFIRLVNDERLAEALAFAAAHDIPALAKNAGGAAGEDAAVALAVIALASGDPADVPRLLADLPVAQTRRDALILDAFIRLVNEARFAEAASFAGEHDIARLAAAQGGAMGADAGIALAVVALASGDPACVPALLAGIEISPARRSGLILDAFIRLVNASRFAEAAAFAGAERVPALAATHGGAMGADAAASLAVTALSVGDPASIPALLEVHDLAPPRRDNLLFAAFTGLINAARPADAAAFAAAQDIFAKLESAIGKAADDARIATIIMEFSLGQTERAVRRLLALREADFDECLLDKLLVDGFIRLVNDGSFTTARALGAGRGIERRLQKVETDLRADAAAALVVLELQPDGETQRIPQRIEEAMQAGLPEDRLYDLALAAFVTLVNRGEFSTARLLTHLVDPVLLKLRPPYSDASRNALFAAGVLGLQDKDGVRPAAANFARLRDALVKLTPPGASPDPLFWPALRGEVLALQRLDRGADAQALLGAFIPLYPDAPDDLAVLNGAAA